MKISTSICAIAALLVPTGAIAQGSSLADAEDLGVPAPADRTVTLLDGVAFDLSVSDEESKASVQVGGFASKLVDENGSPRQTNLNWSLKLSVPVGGTDDLTSDSSLDALSDGTKLTLNVGLFGFRGTANRLLSPRFRTIMKDAIRNCEDKVRRKPDLDADARTAALAACNVGPDPEFALEHSSYSERAINRTLLSSIWQVGLEGSVGLKRFGYLDANTLDDVHDTRTQYAAAVYGALYPSDAMTALIGKLEYQRGYESADEAIVCKPVVVNPTQDCTKGVPTAPSRTENLNLSLEVRRVFDSGWKPGSFAISPKGVIDTLSGEYEIELPVYFIPRGNLPVAPGFKVSYSSEKDKVALGLFLRSTFSF